MKVVFSCGRMNPPTLGHQRVVDRLRAIAEAENGEAVVYLTKSQDEERNPLDPELKSMMVSRAFGQTVRLTQSPYSAVEELIERGVEEAVFVVGQDRLKQFAPLVEFAGKGGLRLRIDTLPRTEEDVSATAARRAALEADFETFKHLTPSPDEGFADELYRAVRSGLGE